MPTGAEPQEQPTTDAEEIYLDRALTEPSAVGESQVRETSEQQSRNTGEYTGPENRKQAPTGEEAR